MRRRLCFPAHRLLLFLVLAAHLVAGPGMAHGYAWCFNSAGESRLEYNPEGRCEKTDPCGEQESDESHHADHGLVSLDTAPGGDCFDLPAVTQSVHPAPRFSLDADLATPLTPPALAEEWSFSLPVLAAVPGFHPQPPPFQQPILACLRTVVLRH